jgi:hypothetical protein
VSALRRAPCLRTRQSGVVAIIVALSLAVMIGFAGLVFDLGRLYINKTELQNAADACTLAAARELTCSTGPCPANALSRAQAAGTYVAGRHQRDFQAETVAIAPDDIRFSTALAPLSAYLSVGEGASAQSRYVMCSARSEGILPWFMGVLGVGAQTVGATAVATVAPSRTNCAIPLAMCSSTPSPAIGVGEWFGDRFYTGGVPSSRFNWIDFTPATPVAEETTGLLRGTGMCDMRVSAPVRMASLNSFEASRAAIAFNSRFGLYITGPGNPQFADAPPDFTGFAYTATSTSPQIVSDHANWPDASNAYDNFLSRRGSHAAFAATIPDGRQQTGLDMVGYDDPPIQSGQLGSIGADRRMVVAPVIDCGGLSGGSTTPVLAWACVLLLHPVANPGDAVFFEYRGLASDANSPCATSGTVGGPGSVGPLVPTLVQ